MQHAQLLAGIQASVGLFAASSSELSFHVELLNFFPPSLVDEKFVLQIEIVDA
jgi:hypothetical protein